MADGGVTEGDRLGVALDREGAGAPPRRNGELVFAAPWESRLFGITMALHGDGRFEWEEFRTRLIAAIGAHEKEPGVEWSYYGCWQTALEGLLAEKSLCARDDLQGRAEEFAARPDGHDHDHPHDHEH